MSELTTYSTPGGSTPAAAPTSSVAHDARHHPIGCRDCSDELQRNWNWVREADRR